MPEDYAVSYRIFTKVCNRTVVNLSETHRKILSGVYDLEQQFPHRKAFTQREISKQGGVSQSLVSDNKTFLVMSAKLLKEGEHGGLTLVEGAVPAWWEEGDLMKRLPSPDQAARVEQLVREGMLRDFAREAALAKRPRKQT